MCNKPLLNAGIKMLQRSFTKSTLFSSRDIYASLMHDGGSPHQARVFRRVHVMVFLGSPTPGRNTLTAWGVCFG